MPNKGDLAHGRQREAENCILAPADAREAPVENVRAKIPCRRHIKGFVMRDKSHFDVEIIRNDFLTLNVLDILFLLHSMLQFFILVNS